MYHNSGFCSPHYYIKKKKDKLLISRKYTFEPIPFEVYSMNMYLKSELLETQTCRIFINETTICQIPNAVDVGNNSSPCGLQELAKGIRNSKL